MLRRFVVTSSLAVAAAAFVAVAPAHAESFSDWTKVSAGENHTCGIRSSGALYCWGNDVDGQVGNGDDAGEDVLTPQLISSSWKTVSAGGSHTCGIKTTGKLFCWGRDADGQVGDGGEATGDVIEPLQIGASLWKAVSAGQAHTCGIKTTGKLFCWGSDDGGPIGNGDEDGDADVLAPEQIGADADWKAVEPGGFHTCGIRATDKLFCWGTDSSGQVGNGDANGGADEKAPVPVGGHWRSISGGTFHTCGIPTSSRLKCWGADGNGQVGNGGEINVADKWAAPQLIGSSTDWTKADGGRLHTCGTRGTGKLFCWGSDAFGQVGNGDAPGTDPDATTPERIGTDTGWKKVSSGGFHTCAIRAGTLYCWGGNNDGQLGIDVVESRSPAPV